MTSRYVPNRWVIAAAGTVVQLCLGTVYAWSYFQSLLVKSYRWSYTDTAWAFSIVVFTLGISAAWAGVNLPKYGPRKLAVAGGLLFSLSYVLGGLALYVKSVPLFYVGYSVVGGIGIGLGYVTPVSTVARWFPERKGLVTGVVVMGFGIGAFVMSKVLAPLLLTNSRGDLVPVFLSLGIVFAVVLLPVTWLLQNPPDSPTPLHTQTLATGRIGAAPIAVGTKDYLASSQFLMMWTFFFFNITAGISVISFQSSLLQEVWGLADPLIDPVTLANYGATLIAVSSLFNGLGRLLWGMVSDRIGRIQSFRLLLGTEMIVFGILMTERNPWVFSALVCYALLCFGGGFGMMPAFVVDVFGSKRMSVMYGAMLTAWAAAGLAGPLMVAWFKDYYPDRAVIYCFLFGVLFLGTGFLFSFLATNQPCRPGKPLPTDLGYPEQLSSS